MTAESTVGTGWQERVAEGEEAELLGYAEQLRELQRQRAARKGRTDRALHAKANLVVRGSLTIHDDLPPHARVGIFAAPGRYDVVARFSNGTGGRQPDRTPDVRGVALKVLGVPGRKLIPGLEDATTQDFLLIRSRSQPFRDPREFVTLVRAATKPALLLPKLAIGLGLGRTLHVLPQLVRSLRQPMTPLAETSYYSALPVQWGAATARYALLAERPGGGTVEDDLGAQLESALAAGPVRWTMAAQFFVDGTRTPIEDASVDWDEAVSPHLPLATLSLEAVPTPEERDAIEQWSFDPWHAPVEFRPLGAMMRARNAAYRLSTIERQAVDERTIGA